MEHPMFAFLHISHDENDISQRLFLV